MHLRLDEPEIIIKWGIRSLYLLLFLSCMVVMGYWHLPFTIPFLGSVFALILPVLFSREFFEADMNKEDISHFDKTRNEHDEHIADI